jgi:hypothetical protein
MASFIIKTREKTRTENGQDILYGLKPNSTVDNVQKIKNFFAKRIYKNGELTTASDGIYTWILKTSGAFYAAKTFTKQELGTLHINLKMLTNDADTSDVYVAGELEMVDEGYGVNTVLFNLLSGTFMASKFKKLSLPEQLFLRNKIVTDVQNVLMGFGLPSVFLECSALKCSDEEKLGGMKLIEDADIKTGPNNVALLNQLFYRRGGTRRTRKAHKFSKTRRHR